MVYQIQYSVSKRYTKERFGLFKLSLAFLISNEDLIFEGDSINGDNVRSAPGREPGFSSWKPEVPGHSATPASHPSAPLPIHRQSLISIH